MSDLYITVQPGMTLHITVAGDVQEDGLTEAAPMPDRPQHDPDEALAAALDRLAKSSGARVRQAAEQLMTLGYELVPASSRVEGKRPENYLRFHDPARPGPAVGYLTPTSISFTRDRDRVANQEGSRIVPSTGEVAFNYADGTERALEIARTLKG